MTLYLATVFGWYFVIFGLLVLTRHEQVVVAVKDIAGSRGLFFILALFTLILGLLVVCSHNYWVIGWPVIITILGWLIVISGVFRLFFLDKAREWPLGMIKHPMGLKIAAVIFLIIGLFLLFQVYSAHYLY